MWRTMSCNMQLRDCTNFAFQPQNTPTRRRSDTVMIRNGGALHKELAFTLEMSRECSASNQPPALTACLKDQPSTNNGVPIVVESCLRYFEANATDCLFLFRVPGDQNRVGKMWDYMEHHPCARLSVNCVTTFMRTHSEFSPHDVASFLKRFFRSMRGGEVITHNCRAPLTDLIRTKCPDNVIVKKFRYIVSQLLVPAQRTLLARLCSFLYRISENSSKTRMDCLSLATCFIFLITPSSKEANCGPPATQQSKLAAKKLKHRQRKRVKEESAEEMLATIRAEVEQNKLRITVIQTMIGRAPQIFQSYSIPTILNRCMQ